MSLSNKIREFWTLETTLSKDFAQDMPFSLDQELNHDKPSGSLTQVHSDSSGKCLSNLA
jgi:hypothetical protein